MPDAAAGETAMMIPLEHAHITRLAVPRTWRYQRLAYIAHMPTFQQMRLQGWL